MTNIRKTLSDMYCKAVLWEHTPRMIQGILFTERVARYEVTHLP